MRKGLITALASFVCVMFAAPTARGEDSQVYQLRPHVEAGQGWANNETNEIKIELQVTAGGQQVKELSRSIHKQQSQQVTVLSAKDGLPTALRLAYGPDCGTTVETTGEAPQKQPLALAGATITIQKGPDGQVTHDYKGQADAATLALLNGALEVDNGFYPAQPVKVGSRWQIGADILKRAFQLGPKEEGTMSCEMVDVKTLDGRPTAVIAMSGQILKYEEGFIEERIELKGSGMMDIGTGHMVKSDINGTITLSGEQQVNGGNGQLVAVKVGGGGKLTIKTDSPIQNAGAAAAPANGAVAPAVALPMLPAMPGGAAAETAADAYVGTFKGEGLVLQIKGEAQRGQYTGSIQLGDKRFTFKAHVTNKGIEGSFDSAGQAFPFVASLADQTLSFDTEGARYALKKQVEAANPLKKSLAANPLN